MPRGPRIILTPNTFRKLNVINPNHPRIRRHVIALIVLSEYRRCNSIDVIHHSKSKSTVPPLFRVILKSFQSRFLNLSSDLTITPIYLWRIHVRKYLPSKMDPNHHVIYFKHRFLEKNEQSTYSIRRLLFPYKDMSSATTIFQNRNTILYYAPDLHSTPHGSIQVNELPSFDSFLSLANINHSIIRIEDSDTTGSVSKNGIRVAYRHHNQLEQLHNKLPDGLEKFNNDVANHILRQPSRIDFHREDGKIRQHEFSYVNSCKWGFGRVQSDNHPKSWSFLNEKMPTLDTEPFKTMPKHVQSGIILVLETATKFAYSTNANAFPDTTRNDLFATTMNASMGHVRSLSKFEYVHIVLTHNNKLKDHIDWKNDHRLGYNFCIVLSTLINIGGILFRMSIIMTTRTTIGAALDKAYST